MVHQIDELLDELVSNIHSDENTPAAHPQIGGGRIKNCIYGSILSDFLVQPAYLEGCDNTSYQMECYIHQQQLNDIMEENPEFIAVQIPIPLIGDCLTVKDLQNLGRIHGMPYSGRLNKEENLKRFKHHYCSNCEVYYSIFKPDNQVQEKNEKEKE